MGIEYSGDNEVFMTADSKEGTYQWGGQPTHMPAGTFPLGWTRTYGDGKVSSRCRDTTGSASRRPSSRRWC